MTVSGQSLQDGNSNPQEMWLTDYQLARAPTGEFTFVTPMVLSDGDVPTWA